MFSEAKGPWKPVSDEYSFHPDGYHNEVSESSMGMKSIWYVDASSVKSFNQRLDDFWEDTGS